MEYEEVRKVIEDKGYLTRAEIAASLTGQKAEMIDANLQFLVAKNKARMVRVARAGKTEDLYYIPG